MPFLRRISTRRLIALCLAALAVVAGGTALALAAGSGGPVPPQRPLAEAIHAALAATEPQGVSARIEFTNHLVDGVDLRGSNPLLAGATGRVWATNDGHFRLELQSSGGGGGDAQVVSDGKTWWLYDGSSNTVYRGTVPPDRHRERSHRAPSVARIQRVLDRVMRHAQIDGPTPGNIAGEPAYTVRATPKRDGGLLGALEYAWDADRGVPLRGAIYARGASDPVLELKATDISFGPVDPGVFDVPPPPGARSQQIAPGGRRGHGKPKLSFKPAAPAALAGRKRAGVDPTPHGGAVVTYGRGLNGIAVIESKPTRDRPLADARLPTVSINGTRAQELSTPLGTVIRFERGGITYTVLGSLPRAAVEAAARGL